MPISILVIDDSDSMRAQIIRTLREALLFDQCHEARDGIEGRMKPYTGRRREGETRSRPWRE